MTENLAYIKFSHFYSKLKDKRFSTIRRYQSDYAEGQIRPIMGPSGILGRAKITKITRKKLADLSDLFLHLDTGMENREKAIRLLNSFYVKPIQPDEILTILILEWVK
jgi:hypothetical protein